MGVLWDLEAGQQELLHGYSPPSFRWHTLGVIAEPIIVPRSQRETAAWHDQTSKGRKEKEKTVRKHSSAAPIRKSIGLHRPNPCQPPLFTCTVPWRVQFFMICDNSRGCLSDRSRGTGHAIATKEKLPLPQRHASPKKQYLFFPGAQRVGHRGTSSMIIYEIA